MIIRIQEMWSIVIQETDILSFIRFFFKEYIYCVTNVGFLRLMEIR